MGGIVSLPLNVCCKLYQQNYIGKLSDGSLSFPLNFALTIEYSRLHLGGRKTEKNALSNK